MSLSPIPGSRADLGPHRATPAGWARGAKITDCPARKQPAPPPGREPEQPRSAGAPAFCSGRRVTTAPRLPPSSAQNAPLFFAGPACGLAELACPKRAFSAVPRATGNDLGQSWIRSLALAKHRAVSCSRFAPPSRRFLCAVRVQRLPLHSPPRKAGSPGPDLTSAPPTPSTRAWLQSGLGDQGSTRGLGHWVPLGRGLPRPPGAGACAVWVRQAAARPNVGQGES